LSEIEVIKFIYIYYIYILQKKKKKDIRDLITLDDVMEELDYGPNGGLVYCME